MREKQLEHPEERRPPRFDALELIVPIVGAGEQTVDDADDTRTAGTRFDDPFGGERRRARTETLTLSGKPTGRIPCRRLGSRLHAGAEIRDHRAVIA